MQAKFMIERGLSSWLVTKSFCCDSGITRFVKSLIACYEQSGSHSRSDSKAIPHLSPLPLRKGEANLAVLSSVGSLSEFDPCYRVPATPGEISTGSTIPPRPVCGERIEVRGYV